MMAILHTSQVLELLEDAPCPWGDAVTIEIVRDRSPNRRRRAARGGGGELAPSPLVRCTWSEVTAEFAAAVSTRSTPKALGNAVGRAREYAEAASLPPLVALPHLAEQHVPRLIDEGVSALDLSGNGLLVVPGSLLLCRTGQPNRYPESQPSRFAYRGSTSIVPRVFLLERAFSSVRAIGDAIAARGVSVAPSTISKALARMEEDVLVLRDRGKIALLQPDALLDRLASAAAISRTWRRCTVRTGCSIDEVFERLRSVEAVTLTGAASMSRYAVGARGDAPAIYCTSLRSVRAALADVWEETDRFADLVVIEAPDKELFFDLRGDAGPVTYASPIQSYIELMGGDLRDQRLAAQIRSHLLDEAGDAD